MGTQASTPAYRPPQSVPYSAPAHQPVSSRPSISTILINATRPTHIYGRRRNYVYYPEIWHDPVSGREYQPGYYDDTGVRYESVAFENNGRYENVVCHCPYCDTKTVMNLNAVDAATQVLDCPNCGGQMEIKSELDDYISYKEDAVSDNSYTDYGNTFSSYTSRYDPSESTSGGKNNKRLLAILLIACVIVTAGKYGKHFAEKKPDSQQNQPTQQIVEITDTQESGIRIVPGQPVYLEKQSDGYHVVNDVLRADKILTWEGAEDSWYDEASDCWLWYNTDVDPASWQYWVEGISSDYGDYGWMEHDEEGWWIEESEGNWIPLPARYGTSDLWYIENGS